MAADAPNPVKISADATAAMLRISQSDAVLDPIPLNELLLLTATIAAGINAPPIP